MVSNALRSSSNLSFLMIFILFQALVFMYSIWDCMYHYLTAVNLDVCDQRQVIFEQRSCRVKGGSYASVSWYEKTFRFGGIKVDMPFIGPIWDLINIALQSSCSDVRIFNDTIHTGVICKEANIRPNVRDNNDNNNNNNNNKDFY